MSDIIFFEKSGDISVGDIVNVRFIDPIPFSIIGTKVLCIFSYKGGKVEFSVECPKKLEGSYRDRRLRECDASEIQKINNLS